MGSFFPQGFFLSRLLAYSGPTLSPTTSNSSGNKTIAGHTMLITRNAEVLTESRVVDTGVFRNVMKRI